jgi:hypothetical protein
MSRDQREAAEVQIIYSDTLKRRVAGAARLQSPRRQKKRVGGGDDNRVEKGGLVTLMGTNAVMIQT